jgi:hypothetical protein
MDVLIYMLFNFHQFKQCGTYQSHNCYTTQSINCSAMRGSLIDLDEYIELIANHTSDFDFMSFFLFLRNLTL